MDYSLTWDEAAAVVVSAAGMYGAMLVLVRVAGRRIVAALGPHDVAAGIALGAVFGRTVLGYTPSLPAGLIGFGTLLGLHAGTRLLLGNPRLDRLLGSGPLLVMKDGHVLPEALRQAKLSEDDLRAALRRAAIGAYAEVGVAVVERTGTISVLRAGVATQDVLTGIDELPRA